MIDFNQPFSVDCSTDEQFQQILPHLLANDITETNSGLPITSMPLHDLFSPRCTDIAIGYFRPKALTYGTCIDCADRPRPVYTFDEFMSLVTPKLTNEQVFIQFLKHYRIFSAFKRAVRNEPEAIADIQHNEATYNVRNVFSHTLTWIATPQGHPYWSNFSRKWQTLCDQFNLQGTIDISTIYKAR